MKSTFLLRLLPIVAILCFGTVTAFAANIDPALDLRLAIGSGLDSSTLEARDDCVRRTEEISPEGGPRVSYSLRVIENSTDLRKYLGISATASLKAALGHIEGKAAFSNRLNINQYSLYALAVTKVINSQTLLRDVTLKKDASDLWVADIEQFRKRCGDQFITGFQDGGEFIGMISIQTTSEEQKRRIGTAISGSYGIFSASGSLDESTLTAAMDYNQAVQIHRHGGDSTTPEPETLEKLIDASVNFPARIAESKDAVKISLLSRAYSTLNLPHRDLRSYDTNERRQVIAQLSHLLDQARDIEANVNYILEHPHQFVEVNEDVLGSAIESLHSNQNAIRASARDCFEGAECRIPSLHQLSALSLPHRRSDQVSAGPRTCDALETSSTIHGPSKHLLDPDFMELATAADVCGVLQAHRGIIHSRGPTNESPLHVAAYSNRQISVIELLVEYGADADTWDINGRLPMHEALQYNENPGIARFLITEMGGKLPDTRESPQSGFSRRPALHLAAENNNPAIVRLLLSEYQQNIHTADNYGTTALHVAAAAGNVATIKVLLTNGANLDGRDAMGRTPLHLATINGHKDVLDVLLQMGASFSLLDDAGNSVLHYAAMLLSGSSRFGFWSGASNVDIWDKVWPRFAFNQISDQKNDEGDTAFEVLLVDKRGLLHQVFKRAPEIGTVAKDKLISQGSWEQVVHALLASNMSITRASECQGALAASLMEHWFGERNSSDYRVLEAEMLENVRRSGFPEWSELLKRYSELEAQEDSVSQRARMALIQAMHSRVSDFMQRLTVTIDLMGEMSKIAQQVEFVIGGSDSVGGRNRIQKQLVDRQNCRYKWDGEN